MTDPEWDMTETEWMECTEPELMAYFLGDDLSPRKLRLFGCAQVRGVWDVFEKDALRQATEVAERFADGLATKKELQSACKLAKSAYEGVGDIIADHGAMFVEGICLPSPWVKMGTGSSGGIGAVAAEAWSNDDKPWHVAHEEATTLHCQLLRDIAGNPFHPVTFDPSWRTTAVVSLAKSIYENRNMPVGTFDNASLAVLADASEEAGCDVVNMLEHLRQPGDHVRGCWVVDLILGIS